MEPLKNLWEVVSGWGRDKDKPAERRSEIRLPIHGRLVVRRDVDGEQGQAVNLLGISEHGMSFRCAAAIASEQKIVIEAEDRQFEAVVRHCEPDGEGFLIGAENLSPDGGPADVVLNVSETVYPED